MIEKPGLHKYTILEAAGYDQGAIGFLMLNCIHTIGSRLEFDFTSSTTWNSSGGLAHPQKQWTDPKLVDISNFSDKSSSRSGLCSEPRSLGNIGEAPCCQRKDARWNIVCTSVFVVPVFVPLTLFTDQVRVVR